MSGVSYHITNDDNLSEQKFRDMVREKFDKLVDSTPVKTGYLKAHWHLSFSGDEATISNPTDYASYVEDNTGFVSGILD